MGSQDNCLSVALVQTISDNSHSYQKRNIMELTSQAYQACYLDALWLSITVAPRQPAKFTPRIVLIFEKFIEANAVSKSKTNEYYIPISAVYCF